MTHGTALAPERHFGQQYSWPVIALVERELGPPGVAQLLLEAGETRTYAELVDGAVWSSYAQVRRLLEAAARLLGGPRLLACAADLIRAVPREQTGQALQQLGSPEALYGIQRAAMASVAPIVIADAREVAPREWLVSQRLADGFEPFPELCSYFRGLHSLSPWMFGFPDVSVVELACQSHGDPDCVFRVRWNDEDGLAVRAYQAEARREILEARLVDFQQTVSDLTLGSDLATVLHRTMVSAARGMQAPAHVLALRPVTGLHLPTSLGLGVDQAEADRVAALLLSDTPPDEWLVVDVASTHRRYGRLGARRTTVGFLETEEQILDAYARMAAIALDAANSLEEARRQSRTAGALLDLSRSLAAISNLEDVASTLAEAVPTVVGCDTSVVTLRDPLTGLFRVAGLHGFAPEHEQLLWAVRPTDLALPSEQLRVMEVTADALDSGMRLMVRIGAVFGLQIAVVVDGEVVGSVSAFVTSDPDRLREDPDVAQRLRGLAAQASTAIRNARLLDQVRYQAFHDSLTGLPNRALILDRVEQMLAAARRYGRPVAAMFIDLDGFKEINDTFGHESGDQMLQSVAERLKTTLRETDTIGRLGGDEFVILLDGDSCDTCPERVAERILVALREPFRTPNGGSLSVTASLGIATGDRADAGELLRDADIALYAAKAAGKDRYVVFMPEMREVVRDRLLLQQDVQVALEQGQFHLAYQPVFSLDTGAIMGAEALLRWNHPTRGAVSPVTFIPLLEETGRIVEVGRWVLHEACRQVASWQRQGLKLTIAVNVSVRQLQAGAVVIDDIRSAIAEHGLDPSSLIVEITESVLMLDARESARRLAELKAVGVRIAIDDFGTGYSSLAYLREFPVDILKIDRSFISALHGSSDARALVHTLVQLGQSLGMHTTAEGIETEEQYAVLREQGCDSGQGFLIARPMPSSDLLGFVEARRAAQANV